MPTRTARTAWTGSLQDGNGTVELASSKADSSKHPPSPERGYDSLLRQGLSRFEIVDTLARKVLNTLDDAEVVKNDRHGDLKGTI